MRHFLKGPRAGSRPYRALDRLYLMGGQADISDWMVKADWIGTQHAFSQAIVEPLQGFQMIFKRGNLFVITDAGMELTGHIDPRPPTSPPAGPRYVPPMRALSASNMPKLRLMREGAHDYRDIPSLHGSLRTSYRTGVKAEGSDGGSV